MDVPKARIYLILPERLKIYDLLKPLLALGFFHSVNI